MKNMPNEKRTTRRGKALYFDDSEDRLDKSIRKRMEEGDYLSALRLAGRRDEFFPATPDSYAMQADLYELAEAHAQALKMWYRFLNVCDEDSLAEAYEGLAVNYMNLGKETQSAYYYNQLLRVDDDLTPESKMDIVEMFSKPKRERFHTVYPPEKADYTEEIERGVRALRESDFPAARQAFGEVAAGSRQYRSAQNLLAISYLLEDKKAEARALCEKLIAEKDDDVQAYTTYAAVLGQLDEHEKAREIAEKLCTMQTDDTDELYKIATVCCENGLDAEALEKFIRLEEDLPNDRTLLYFKAVAAYKSGNIPLCLETFDRLLVLCPAAAVARYYYDSVRYYLDNKGKEDVPMPELTYYYRVPQKVRDTYCDLLYFLDGLRVKEAASVSDNPQVLSVLEWCFDEMDGSDGDLQTLALCVAVHCRYDRFVEDVLLDPDVSDVVKVSALQLIAERNKDTEYGAVVYHIYRRIRFYHLKISGKKRKKFLQAYAAVYAKFSVISDNHAQRIRASAELLYNCLSLRGAYAYMDAPADVSCAIYLLAGIRETGGASSAAGIFDADEGKAAEILHLVREVTGEVLRRSNAKGAPQEERKERKEEEPQGGAKKEE